MTHYATLGVGENADADEIKRAYRKLASQHHPDKGGDTAKFQAIQTAYDTLSDTGKRQQYDMERQGMGNGIHFQFNGGMPGGIHDIFRNFGFPGAVDPFGQMRQPPPRRNKDLRVEIAIPLVDTLSEITKTISVQTTNGHREILEVKLPRGVTNGTNIKYPGLGDNLFNTLPRGDLYVQIAVHGSEHFVVRGIDLYSQISVNCLTAIVGGTAIISGLDNREFELSIPAGVQPNTKFRIANQGLFQMNTLHRGDLYVELQLSVPQNLTPDQLQTIESIVNPQ
jgi:DnaJ-class molecular chaperone